jgi:hypothetical protein
VDVCFVDDSNQRTPWRQGMGPLVAAGAVIVPGDQVKELEAALGALCATAGFPQGEEFKWHPAKGSWMQKGLVEGAREQFCLNVVALLAGAGAKAVIVVEDEDRNPAIFESESAADDVTALLLERINSELNGRRVDGIIVVDRPGGHRPQEDKFLATSLDLIAKGTRFVKFDRIALNVLSTDSKMVRCLQAADLVTSSVTALVAGEDRFSPPIFAAIHPMFPRDFGRIGGLGLKIHPDFRYANLYHWLLGDSHFVRYQSGYPLPFKSRPYAIDALVP